MRKSQFVKGILLSCLIALFIIPSAQADKKHADDKVKKLAVDKVEKEGLSVIVLGSGGPIATSEGRASAGYLIFTDGEPRILMDAGGGTFQRLAQSGTNIKNLDIVLLSHLHADHTGDLTPIIKTAYFHAMSTGTARSTPFRIWGPGESTLPATVPGVRYNPPLGPLVYPASADYVDGHYAIPDGDERYLKAFVNGISQTASSFAYEANNLSSAVAGASEQLVLDEGIGDKRLVIKAIAVDHGPVPAVAYKITYKNNTVVYSGDTGTKGPGNAGMTNMVAISRNADLLIYDTAVLEKGMAPPNPLFHTLHTQPSLIAAVATEANVKKLVLSHLTPVTSPNIDLVKTLITNNGYTGKIKVAKDLKVYNLGDDD